MGSIRPIAAAFVVFGTFWGGWAVAAADVEREFALSHSQFGLILSVGLVGAALANAFGGALAERYGTQRTLSASFALWALSLGFGALSDSALMFAAALFAVVTTGGVVDVVMNVAATSSYAGEPGKLVRFHGLFNVGAAIGAAGVGIAIGNAVNWRWAWAAVALAALVLAAVFLRVRLPAGQPGERAPLWGALSLLRRERLGLVAAAFAIGALVEGGIELWGVLFLRTTLGSTLRVAVTSAVCGYLVAATARIVFGPAAGRGGAARGVSLGAGTACGGIAVLALFDSPLVAGFGLVLAAGGISMCWPLLLSLAAADRARPGAVVGAVTSVGYLGFVVGPSVVGWVAGFLGLRWGLALIAVAAAFVAVTPAIRNARSTASARTLGQR